MVDGEVVARIDRLERENRNFKRLGAGVLIAALGLVAMGQAAAGPQVLSAGRVELKDAEGRVRIALDATSAVNPYVTLRDSGGKQRIFLSLMHGDAPYLRMNNQTGAWMALEAPNDGQAGLDIRNGGKDGDKNGPWLGVGVRQDGTSVFGNGRLAAGKAAFIQETKPDGSVSLELRNQAGEVVFKAPE